MEGISAGEISRRLDMISKDMRDDFAEIKRKMDSYVLREVYTADRAALTTQLAEIQRRVDAELADIRARAELESTQRRAAVKWVWGTVVVPVFLAAVAIGFNIITK